MEPQEHYSEKFERAKKRVKELKDFYGHLKAFMIVNILLFLLRSNVLNSITLEQSSIDADFLHWLDWNFLITPVLWGIGLLIHGLYAHRYKFKFIAKWESRQIQKYMEQEPQEIRKQKE